MKIKAKKTDIKEVIATAGSIAGSGSTALMITSSLLIEAKDGKATFTGTNLDQTVTITIPCEVAEEGMAAIPAMFLARIVGVSDVDEVEIEAPDTNEGGCGRISFGDSKYNVSVFNVADFPRTDMVEGDEWIVDANVLNDLIKNTKYAVSNDQTRAAISNLLFEFRKDDLTLVGTDGRRLSSKNNGAVKSTTDAYRDSLLPPAAVSAIVKMVSGRDGELSVKASPTGMIISASTWNIKTKVGDSAFPNWRAIIPKEYAHSVTINRTMLSAKISQVMVSCPREDPVMSMKFTDGLLSLYISDRSGSDAKTKFPVNFKVPGDGDVEILLNPIYLQDVLSNAGDDELEFSFTDGGHPVRISGKDLCALVMPVRKH